jgi:hypothetical protein
MNRKLHNTVSAFFASAGLLVLGLVAANPTPVAGVAPYAATDAAGSGSGRTEAAAQRIEARAALLEQELAASRDASQAVAGVAAFAAEAATLAVMAGTLDALEAAEAPSRPAAPRKPRRSRQSVAMPFFSFAPRG